MDTKKIILPTSLLLTILNPELWYYIIYICLRIVTCIQYCVTGYFIIFNNIFINCLGVIKILIGEYFCYLSFLTYRLTIYPTNIIFVTGATAMLYIIRLILKDIIPFKISNNKSEN